jgi:hypothetical protein
MSGPLSSPRPLFEVKIGVASWVRRGRRPRPAAGNPNFNLKKRPYRNKSGPGKTAKTAIKSIKNSEIGR